MNIANIIEKELAKSVEAGFGTWCKSESRKQLGLCIYKSGVINKVSIELYDTGLRYIRELNGTDITDITILYENINTVQSYLSASVYSEAKSKPEGYLELHVMTLHLKDKVADVKLPLVIYSGILRALCDIFRKRGQHP